MFRKVCRRVSSVTAAGDDARNHFSRGRDIFTYNYEGLAKTPVSLYHELIRTPFALFRRLEDQSQGES
jgi:hypothetical protein